ncbi:dehydration-responsive element-binding protein 1H-like [Lolium rigidum]|uniref:dehydration-responsive element-binding protein 1H-like n=1 Tax=Lolium rigidum TaxID=89674 RepID=UPI001F5C930B|nr:dehydration-responsive element-binding protein 1H-like [Lolium rigidum]
MDTGIDGWTSCSPSPSTPEHGAAHPKRPAGRTKFKETRHPVYRGVRRRGSAGRWVCEVRVPGKRGERLWLGTYVAAESAARAHDAAMLALRGCSASVSALASLNFPDSAWLLAVPPWLADLAAVRRAAVEAVAVFLRREAADCAVAVVPIDEATSIVVPVYEPTSTASIRSSVDNADELFVVPTFSALDLGGNLFELDLSGEIDLDTYYAGLAEGMLLEPPPTPYWESRECGNGDAALWSY